MSEWIPIDQPPEEDGVVAIGLQLHGSISHAYPMIFFDEGEAVHVNDSMDDEAGTITHWIPIPPLPEMEGG